MAKTMTIVITSAITKPVWIKCFQTFTISFSIAIIVTMTPKNTCSIFCPLPRTI
ncbi:hypothetical protein RhiirC2_731988 [Rhizophagus irregularis]|uniref:Uncharacterized protein n=1 Tax=Rhizophagus irregularis TaxID=588596 RepID=A0A2N1NU72_9GLOM|nr:hypothetical protein RhiirC2_731988 [Rhizophagus irregularis]